MLTAKGKYSLKALAHLATLDSRATTQAVDIAETNSSRRGWVGGLVTCVIPLGVALGAVRDLR